MNAFDRPVPTLSQQTQYMADAVNASGCGFAGDEKAYDPEDERYESEAGQLDQAVAAALNTASTLRAAGADTESVRAYATLIAAMMGDSSFRNREAVLMAITTRDTTVVPLAQAARDAMMPYACGECGVEVTAPDTKPDHFEWCPRHPDALADAKRILFDRILARTTAGLRDEAERYLMDLLDLAEDGLDETGRDELIREVLPGPCQQPRKRAYAVAPGEPMTVPAASPEEAVAQVLRELAREEAAYGDAAEDPDPNPRFYVHLSGSRGPWQEVHLHAVPGGEPHDTL